MITRPTTAHCIIGAGLIAALALGCGGGTEQPAPAEQAAPQERVTPVETTPAPPVPQEPATLPAEQESPTTAPVVEEETAEEVSSAPVTVETPTMTFTEGAISASERFEQLQSRGDVSPQELEEAEEQWEEEREAIMERMQEGGAQPN